jgi:hypothetical protein
MQPDLYNYSVFGYEQQKEITCKSAYLSTKGEQDSSYIDYQPGSQPDVKKSLKSLSYERKMDSQAPDCDRERLLILRSDRHSESMLSCSFMPLPLLGPAIDQSG